MTFTSAVALKGCLNAMKHLFTIRQANFLRLAGYDDFDRRLAVRGRRAVPEMG